jgi:hypothetical protein
MLAAADVWSNDDYALGSLKLSPSLPSVAKATAESMLMTLWSTAMHAQSSNPPRLSLHSGTLQAAPSAPNLSLDSPSSFLERPSSAPLRSSGLTPSPKPRVASSRVERFNRILGAPTVDLGMHGTCAIFFYSPCRRSFMQWVD